MQLKCYHNREHRVCDAAAFAAFRADSKYVIGIMPTGDEYLLPHNISLRELEIGVPDIMRVSRATLVARKYVTAVVYASTHKCVLTVAGEYRLARRLRAEPFAVASVENATRQQAVLAMPAQDFEDEAVGRHSAFHQAPAVYAHH